MTTLQLLYGRRQPDISQLIFILCSSVQFSSSLCMSYFAVADRIAVAIIIPAQRTQRRDKQTNGWQYVNGIGNCDGDMPQPID